MKILNYFLVLLMIVFSVNTSIALENKPVMDLALAKKLADACEAKKATTDWRPLNIAIVDAGADLILFRRQDGAFLGSVDIAINTVRLARNARKWSSYGFVKVITPLVR